MGSTGRRWARALLVGALLVTPARAEGLIDLPDACPPGARGEFGGWCVPSECARPGEVRETNAEFGITLRCRPLRVCTEDFEHVRRHPVFFDYEDAVIREVVETCGPGESCVGQGERAPTRGRRIAGSLHCRDMMVWVEDPLPQLMIRERANASPRETGMSGVPESKTEAAAKDEQEPASEPGCGCRSGGASGSPAALASVLVPLFLMARRLR